MNLFWLGFIVAFGSLYGSLFIVFFAVAYHEYRPNAISRSPSDKLKWYRTWWGRPIAASVDALLWPVAVVRLVYDEI